MEWTKEFYGVSHLGEYSTKKLWVSVNRHSDGCATLAKHFPGCGFFPDESHHESVEDAKMAGEIAMGLHPVDSEKSGGPMDIKVVNMRELNPDFSHVKESFGVWIRDEYVGRIDKPVKRSTWQIHSKRLKPAHKNKQTAAGAIVTMIEPYIEEALQDG